MTPLVAIIVVILLVVLAANVLSRARSGVRSVRSHHRALDTLGHITTRRPVAAHRPAVGVGALTLPDTPRQAHIRLVPVMVEEEPVPEPPVEIEIEIEEPVVQPVLSLFRLSPAPNNDLWDTVAIRELIDGPDEVDEAREVVGDGDSSELVAANGMDAKQINGVDATQAEGLDAAGSNGTDPDRPDPGALPAEALLPAMADRSGAPWAVEDRSAGTRSAGDHFGSDGYASGVAVAGWRRSGRGPRRTVLTGPVGPGRPRRSTRRLVATAMVLLLCIVTVAVVLNNRHHATPAAAAPASHLATAAPALRRSPKVVKPKHVATKVAVRLVSSLPGTLHYRLAGGARVTLKAIGPCWVEIRRTDANGQEVYTATMAAGATESVMAPAWVRLGRPTAVAVSVGGATVTPPVLAGRPYNLLFD